MLGIRKVLFCYYKIGYCDFVMKFTAEQKVFIK